MAPDFRRRTWSSSAGGSATERSPSPPEVFLAPRRLDEAFVAFLTTHLSSHSSDPQLARYVADRDILNPFAAGDRVDRVTRLFVDDADTVRQWISDDSDLKERLREFPAIFRRLWPAEAELDVQRFWNPDVGKRKREREKGEELGVEGNVGGDGEGGGPGPESAKRRRVGVDVSAGDDVSVLGSPAESAAAEEEVPAGAGPSGEEEPVTAGPSNVSLSVHRSSEQEKGKGQEDVHAPPSGTSLPAPPATTSRPAAPSRNPFPFPSPPPRIIPDYTTPVPPAETVDPDELQRGVTRLDRSGREWTEDTAYKGTRQPPLGVRLEHMLNFLREEDVDRCSGWEDKLGEIEEWVRARGWNDSEVEGGKGEGEEKGVGTQTANMIEDVMRKVRAHRLFEADKYGNVGGGQGIKREGEVARPRRGRRTGVRDGRAIELGEKLEDEERRRVLVAAPERVHTQFRPVESVENDEFGEVNFFLKRLNESEKAFWNANPDSDGREEYLFNLENAAYEACSAPAGPLARFKTKGGKGALILPPEEELPPPPEALPEEEQQELDARLRKHATERGARRAALQGALRCFTNTEQTRARTEWNRVVPAVEQETLDEARWDVDRNYQWQPPTLDRDTAPARLGKLETMPYTVAWRLHRKWLADLAEDVRKDLNEKNAHTRGWATVPKGVAYGGPFVWRMVDPEVQEQQDLLKECEAVLKAILRSPKSGADGGDKSVLQGVKHYALMGTDGHYGASGSELVPEELELELGDNDKASFRRRLTEPVNKEELKWLGFLAGKSVNKPMLEATEQSQFVLYSIFATRLEKAMDDRRETALFLHPYNWRTIEELLRVINRAADQSDKEVRFTAFQARYFLERAQEQGLCRYKHDHQEYGRVARSVRDIEPFDRIKVPVTMTDSDDNQVLVPMKRDHIGSFRQLPAVSATDRQQNKNSFLTLGLRLGLTISGLRRAQKDWQEAKPLGLDSLRDALQTFDRVHRNVKEEYSLQLDSSSSELGLSLARFVKNTDPAAWEEHVRAVPETLPSEHRTPDTEDAATEAAALRIIRHKIIQENHENVSMLCRGRGVSFKKPDGSNGSAWTYDHNWDWASVEVRGKAKQFFSLDRWPLELQSEETRGRIRSDEFVELDTIADPAAEDPIPKEYFRAKLRRYDNRERSRHRPGLAIYPIGDTPLQRRMVRGMLAERVARATGVYPGERPQSWRQRLANMWPSRRWLSPDDDAMAQTSLPEVDPSLVPQSWTPPATSPGSRSEGENRDDFGEHYSGGDQDDVQMEDR